MVLFDVRRYVLYGWRETSYAGGTQMSPHTSPNFPPASHSEGAAGGHGSRSPTSRYLHKVHGWICSLSLTTEIPNNLGQMPRAQPDVSPAPTSLSAADVSCSLPSPVSSRRSPGAAPSVDGDDDDDDDDVKG